MTILGIESSCDDTAAAILVDGEIRAHVVATQLDHSQYGGVVPEVASRLHEQNILPVVRDVLNRTDSTLSDLDAIAVTHGPGLAGALAVGVSFAKGLAQSLDIPIIGVNHMEGHLWAGFLGGDQQAFDEPFVCLLASGGHTHLWHVRGAGDYELLGRSLDDAAGEAFDKGARLLGLGYPGGPAIQAAAVGGDQSFVKFPRPMVGKSEPNYSFSGLKTALFYYLKKLPDAEKSQHLRDIAASYQTAIVDCLLDRLQVAAKQTGLTRICVAGGVSANTELRSRLSDWSNRDGTRISYPPLEFCTDNAAMIAMAGYQHLAASNIDGLDLAISPNLSLAS